MLEIKDKVTTSKILYALVDSDVNDQEDRIWLPYSFNGVYLPNN